MKNVVKCRWKGFKNIIYMLQREMKRKAADGKTITGRVEFDVPYAVRIHEDLEMYHSNGQAKFLEIPHRRMTRAGDLSRIVKAELKKGRTMRQAIRTALEELKREAQKLTPVKTGRLRRSARVVTEAR